MRILLRSSSWYTFGAIILIATALFLGYSALSTKQVSYVTATVSRATVSDVVSVSGVVEAQNTAELAFPVTGIITEVFVDEGDRVETGDALATLAANRLVAERNEAMATLESARADRAELIAGPRAEARVVTQTNLDNAISNLRQTIDEQAELVTSARTALLSSGLTARSLDDNESSRPPLVSGTYTCDQEGRYVISLFSSNAGSGYSYRVSGLETGTHSAFVDSPGSFGTCGLFLQFFENQNYSMSEWVIDIPNQESATYVTNRNAYEIALTNQINAITSAENALDLAEDEAVLANAAPRTAELERADAAINQAQARIAAIDAEIADRSIVAPFSGMITDVTILPGEITPSGSAITLLKTDEFELLVRIPEIDITKIASGQRAEMVFDAQTEETVVGTIDFISPLATEIDGVAYFEAMVIFEEPPVWLRSGLNADVAIVIDEKTDALVVPKRFVSEQDGEATVSLLKNGVPQSQSVELGFVGNDGLIEVIGLPAGTTVIAP